MSPIKITEVGVPDPDSSPDDVAYYNDTMERLGRAINEVLKTLPGRDERRISWMLAIDLPLPSGESMFGGYIGNCHRPGNASILLRIAAHNAESLGN